MTELPKPQLALPGWYLIRGPCGCTQERHTLGLQYGPVKLSAHQPGCPEYRFRSPPPSPPLAVRLAAERFHQAEPHYRFILTAADQPGQLGKDARLIEWWQSLEPERLLDLWAC